MASGARKGATGERPWWTRGPHGLRAARATAEAGGARRRPGSSRDGRRAGAAAPTLRATKSSASYLGERSIRHLDPGAVSTSLIRAAAPQP